MIVAAAGAAAAVAAAALLAAPAHAETQEPRPRHGAQVAKLVTVTPARARPGGGPLVRMLATRTHWNGGAQELLVLGSATARDGREWLRVRLPGRPNGASGWIRRDAARVHTSRWWVTVSLRRRLVSVYRAGVLVRNMHAVVGATETPTPRGLFAVYERVPQPRADGFLGPWAILLTAFSDVLERYGGGPGRIAIHGRGGASLRDPLGTAASHGCVRVDNADAVWLARRLLPGTPVQVGL